MSEPFLPEVDAFGPEYPALTEVVKRAHQAFEESGDTIAQVTRKERDEIYAEMDEWAATHWSNMGEPARHYSGYGSIRLEVIDG